VRVSVPAASNKRFAGGGVNAKDAEKKDASASVGGDGDASLWSSASSKSRGDAPVSALRGVGSKSAARLASLGVVSVGDLASLSDARCAEIRKTPNEAEKGASVLGLRDKARRALGGAWET
jgi:predicted flap endonuclease-1-like 5' DNA nuclease